RWARHLAGEGERVGLIEFDAGGCRVWCFEPASEETESSETSEIAPERIDPAQLTEALDELNLDVDRWLLLIDQPRMPEARSLLRLVDHWVLLCEATQEGTITAYRALKGLADARRPLLTLALLDAVDDAEAGRLHARLAGVCQQFLAWTLRDHVRVDSAESVIEQLVMECQATHDKAAMATAAHWQALNGFLARPQRVMRLRDDRNETAGEAALRVHDDDPIAGTPAA